MHFSKLHALGLLSLLSHKRTLAAADVSGDTNSLESRNFLSTAPFLPIVISSAGIIKGRIGRLNPSVHEYLGIPFARPPVGSRRFAPPERLPNQLISFIDATKFGASCPSAPPINVIPIPWNVTASHYGEDCLSLNVWTKPGRRNAPVLVFLYGGAFIWGLTDTKLYDGTIFANNNDAVIVTVK